MKTPHKHAELIKAWADGHEIEETYAGQGDNGAAGWHAFEGNWDKNYTVFRIKPEPKPDIVGYFTIAPHSNYDNWPRRKNIKATFDGKTNKLKAVEVIS